MEVVQAHELEQHDPPNFLFHYGNNFLDFGLLIYESTIDSAISHAAQFQISTYTLAD